MSAIIIVGKLLHAAPNVTKTIEIGRMKQPMQVPFIVLYHTYESQDVLLVSAVERYETRVSVEIVTDDAIECDRQAEAVKACLSYVAHRDVSNGSDPGWEDVSCFKAGGDVFDYDDERTVYRRVIDYRVQWKPAQ
jgi:hypothetical protein